MNWLRCPSGSSALRMLEASAQLRISGWHADVAYALVYENSGRETLHDVQFVFPVDDSAAVYRLVALLNGRTIECECRDKTEAKAAYTAAVSLGHSAAFMGEADGPPDLMECFLGNVATGEQVRIAMSSVVQLDTPRVGEIVLTIPRVLVPRYDAPKEGVQKAAPSVTPLSMDQSWLRGLRLNGSVCGLPSVKQVLCNQGKLLWKPLTAEFEVTQLNSDCDIELTVEFHQPATSSAWLMREAGLSGSRSALFRHEAAELTAFFEEPAEADSQSPATEFVIVVDRSGSMSGSNIRAAREALLLFLKSLPAGCRFNVVSFGSHFSQLFPTSQLYSEGSLAEALRLQANMEADMGGTEILPALMQVFDAGSSASRLRVFLLTDGEVSNSEQVKDFVLSKCATSGHRLFAIGIGQGASTALVKGVARVGGGFADFVRDGAAEQLRSAVIGQLKAARAPVVADLQVTACTLDGKSALLGTVPTDPLASGRGLASLSRVKCFLLLTPEASAQTVKVTASFSISGKQVTVECSQEAAPAPPSADAAERASLLLLHRAAARLQLKEWTDSNASGAHTRDIVELSLAANLTSAHTAFVGIDRATKLPVFDAHLTDGAERMLMPQMVCGMSSMGGGGGGGGAWMPNFLRRSRAVPQACMAPAMACAPMSAPMSAPMTPARSRASLPPPPPPQMACAAPPAAIRESRDAGSRGGMLKSLASMFRLGPQSSAQKRQTGSAAVPSMDNVNADSCKANEEAVYDPVCMATATDSSSSSVVPVDASSADPILQIASTQRFDGHWDVTEEIARILGMSVDEIRSSAPEGPLDAWVTALVCAHLSVNLKAKRRQWELLVDKAVGFIKAACGSKADSFLSSARALVEKSAG